MVMTQKAAPRMSMLGACVATLVLTAGTFVMPGLACPPEECTTTTTTKQGQTTISRPAKVKAGKVTIAPGQAVVLYDGTRVVGSATIASTTRASSAVA